MSHLRELYQEVILDHNRRPRNFQKSFVPTCQSEGYNPLCGDRFTLYLDCDGERVKEIGFDGSGCAISKASCSMMTEAVKGRSPAEILKLFQQFHQMITGAPGAPIPEGLGKLAVFSGVCEFPSRVKCASLAWHTLKTALDGKEAETVSTEKEDE